MADTAQGETSSPSNHARIISRLPLPASHTSPIRDSAKHSSTDKDERCILRDSDGSRVNGRRASSPPLATDTEHLQKPSSHVDRRSMACALPASLKRDISAFGPPRKFSRPKATLSQSLPVPSTTATSSAPTLRTLTGKGFGRRTQAVVVNAPGRRSTPPGSPTTMHGLQADFSDLRNCFAELSVTVARQHERIKCLEDVLARVVQGSTGAGEMHVVDER
ncbi:hypothetical protein BCR37DRAFT_258017 [Protomyces lactucae-debilis]|uniref:Uncharacterized protein n=1 Tax=Protomyces lactucae-debilis TaxID=2754530 RepID=A0A1Y2FM77_PROLT|nr:uncharacterized protein BCR37DRAFT_258017 [Protomyces lactucae-debilis]ORY85082.1 hypothetical protein BCR37DRAFT_258017 [Protomyces lactucae-debilis]